LNIQSGDEAVFFIRRYYQFWHYVTLHGFVILRPYTDIQLDFLENVCRKYSSVRYRVENQGTNIGIRWKESPSIKTQGGVSHPQGKQPDSQGHSSTCSDKQNFITEVKRKEQWEGKNRQRFLCCRTSQFILQNHPIWIDSNITTPYVKWKRLENVVSWSLWDKVRKKGTQKCLFFLMW